MPTKEEPLTPVEMAWEAAQAVDENAVAVSSAILLTSVLCRTSERVCES